MLNGLCRNRKQWSICQIKDHWTWTLICLLFFRILHRNLSTVWRVYIVTFIQSHISAVCLILWSSSLHFRIVLWLYSLWLLRKAWLESRRSASSTRTWRNMWRWRCRRGHLQASHCQAGIWNRFKASLLFMFFCLLCKPDLFCPIYTNVKGMLKEYRC